MVRSFAERKRFRKNFGSLENAVKMPHLIELQKTSYEAFLQYHVPFEKRQNHGLQEIFKSYFPIVDFGEKAQLEFYRYQLGSPKFDEFECRQKGLTYSAPLHVTFRLIVWDIDETTKVKSIRDIKEQSVYICDIPLISDHGTFIINGIERVVVSQMHRSPGVFFDHDKGKSTASGKILYVGRVVPYRGSWLDLEFDPKDMLYARIDRRRKFLLSTFLMALDSTYTEQKRKDALASNEKLNPKDVSGMSRDEMIATFYKIVTLKRTQGGWTFSFGEDMWSGQKVFFDVAHPETKEVLVASGDKFTKRLAKKLSGDGVKELFLTDTSVLGQTIARDYINPENGQIYLEVASEINAETLQIIEDQKITELDMVWIDEFSTGPYLINTMRLDKNHNREDALLEIYRTLRPGEPPALDGVEALFHNLFFNPERYDMSMVGRAKFNASLNLDVPDDCRVLLKSDIIAMLKHLFNLRDGRGDIDDIDSLINRRVRSVGELLENQFRLGMARMERSVYERMGNIDMASAMPNDLINAKSIAAVIREFFGTSQLSQFMDQTNPLSEVTHKRRLSALGPGGLSRERASFEVRDVHPTHYGRICPIETPEGPNIGLINSLATYARVNKYGFIETPYRKVVDGKVTDQIMYMNAREEAKYIIAQAKIKIDKKDGTIKEDYVACRKNGEVSIYPKDLVEYIDVSPKQISSVAASLIPFLENDDANRALMGSNMQRQAVPLLKTEAPLVGTGMECHVARDSGASILAKRSGVVDQVDGKRIVIKVDEEEDRTKTGVDIYHLLKFKRSNMSTCINQRPLVKKGDVVKEGDVIADGPSIDTGELALGKNVRVAFMSWQGYNFEDSIVISERLIAEDTFTSIHIEEFEVMARDTKIGDEEITRDLPNATDESLKYLDEAGIIQVGAEVRPGDILVGKVTPKGESVVTPEEKLLRAVFGEKALDVKDSSLRLPSGTQGTVVEVRVFSRKGVDKDERAIAIERQEIDELTKNRDAERNILEKSFKDRVIKLLVGQKVQSGIKPLKPKMILTRDILDDLGFRNWRYIVLSDEAVMQEFTQIQASFDEQIGALDRAFENNVDKLKRGDDLPPGVLKMVKVFVAVKRRLQPGDKMSGRHGNKGVVSRIVPMEDMPYMDDGTPVDIILNPLGLPSRMNVGQILETHLGAAAHQFGKQVQKLMEEYRAGNTDFNAAKAALGDIYEKDEDKEDIQRLDEEEFIELTRHLKNGVPVATPVFDGASEDVITHMLEKAGLDRSGQVTLYDGRNGEPLDRKVTVGFIYMLKLHHLVDDKIHARSIGPYSLVTQQPLGGKAQFGGQRFGEMEVWALQAYGAAYTLQEILTAKADDINGRMRVYDAIVRDEDNMELGIPESFNVLVKEIRSLGLDLTFEKNF